LVKNKEEGRRKKEEAAIVSGVHCTPYTNLMGRCTYLDPPRISLKKGDFEKNLVPPLLSYAL